MVKLKKEIHGYGRSSNSVPQTTVKFCNDEINDMIKIVKALEDSDILMKGSTEALQNDAKKVVLYQFYPFY